MIIWNIWRTLFNIGIPIAALFAVNGNQHCKYIIYFVAIFNVAVTPLLIVALFAEHPENQPFWQGFSHLSDATLTAILVWNGWLFTSLCVVYGWIWYALLFQMRTKKT